MTTSVLLRHILDRKQHEICTPAPVTGSAGVFSIPSSRMAGATDGSNYATNPPLSMYVTGASAMYMWTGQEDAYHLLPASGIGGSFGASACGTWHPDGPTGTASAGGAKSITTATTVLVDLAGYAVRITGGTGAGQTGIIASNTKGANAVLTMVANWGTNPDATSTYKILSGRFYVLFGAATPGFRYWDHATQAWSAALTVTGLTHTGTDGQMACTPSAYASFATGTATSGSSTTLVDSTRTWTASQWVNYQVRITAGTGKGQVRTITANTATQLTFSAGATIDATSVYVIEGNDDFIYVVGNGTTTITRYSISGNSWSSMTARGANTLAGATLDWVYGASGLFVGDSVGGNVLNGRRLYSFRGGAAASGALDYYDIPSNAWTATVAYGGAAETMTTGSAGTYDGGDRIYLYKDATGRLFFFDVVQGSIFGWTTNVYTQGAAVVGKKMFLSEYRDGVTSAGVSIRWVHYQVNSSAVWFRTLVI